MSLDRPLIPGIPTLDHPDVGARFRPLRSPRVGRCVSVTPTNDGGLVLRLRFLNDEEADYDRELVTRVGPSAP